MALVRFDPDQCASGMVWSNSRQCRIPGAEMIVMGTRETFRVVQVPSASGPTWRIVRKDPRGGEALLPSVYATEREAQREVERLTSQTEQ
jgi:hypothetical protein